MVTANETASEMTIRGPEKAVLLELENVAVDARCLMAAAAADLFKRKGVKMSPVHYSKYGVDNSVGRLVKAVLEVSGKGRVAADKLAQEIDSAGSSAIAGAKKATAGVVALLGALRGEPVLVGALTHLPEEAAGALVSGIGLDALSGFVMSCSNNAEYFSADAWLKLSKRIGMPSSRCLAVATSAASCKAALSVGMQCVVVADKYTAFQDFSGADSVVDVLDDATIRETITLLELS